MSTYYGIDFNQLINNNTEYIPKYIFEDILYDVEINLSSSLSFIIKHINGLIIFGILINNVNIDSIPEIYNANKNKVLEAIDNIIYSKTADFVDISNLNIIREMIELSEFYNYNITH